MRSWTVNRRVVASSRPPTSTEWRRCCELPVRRPRADPHTRASPSSVRDLSRSTSSSTAASGSWPPTAACGREAKSWQTCWARSEYDHEHEHREEDRLDAPGVAAVVRHPVAQSVPARAGWSNVAGRCTTALRSSGQTMTKARPTTSLAGMKPWPGVLLVGAAVRGCRPVVAHHPELPGGHGHLEVGVARAVSWEDVSSSSGVPLT
jgi:hypothetical protein